MPLLVTMLVAAAMACGGDEKRPVFTPLPTPTTPPDFVTFTDESSLFSIKYPADWELALSLMADLELIVKDVLENKDSDLPLGRFGFVFFAGVPVEEGYDPSVNIAVESLPTELSLNEYSEAALKVLKQGTTGFELYSQASAIVGGRDARIVDAEYDLSSFDAEAQGRVRGVQLYMVDGKVAWAVACGAIAPLSEEYLQTCDAVVRSFRILQ